MRFRIFTPLIAASLLLSGCGTYVPHIEDITDQPGDRAQSAAGKLEANIKVAIYCELRDAVVYVTSGKAGTFTHGGGKDRTIPDEWGAQVGLSLQVDETGALTPGIAPISTLPIHSFTLGAGVTASSQATHIDKFSSYYLVRDLKKGGTNDSCHDKDGALLKKPPGSSPYLTSQLGLKQWLIDAMIVENKYPSESLPKDANTAFSQDTMSYEARFIVITSASLTTDWKLVNQTSVQGMLPTASANRTKTHDLIITFGPSAKPTGKGGIAQPGNAANNSDLASQIGAAISTQLRTVPSSPLGF